MIYTIRRTQEITVKSSSALSATVVALKSLDGEDVSDELGTPYPNSTRVNLEVIQES